VCGCGRDGSSRWRDGRRELPVHVGRCERRRRETAVAESSTRSASRGSARPAETSHRERTKESTARPFQQGVWVQLCSTEHLQDCDFVFLASSYILITDKQSYGQSKLFFSNEEQKRGCQANLFAFACISFP